MKRRSRKIRVSQKFTRLGLAGAGVLAWLSACGGVVDADGELIDEQSAELTLPGTVFELSPCAVGTRAQAALAASEADTSDVAALDGDTLDAIALRPRDPEDPFPEPLEPRPGPIVVPPPVPPPQPGPACSYTGAAPSAVGERRARLRVLSQNAFGLDRDGNANCKARSQALGNAIATASPPYDIVALQEHWESFDAGWQDCDPSFLSNAIWSSGRYTNSNNYYRHRPRGEWYELETDGGLSIFSLHPIEQFDENEWDDIPGVLNTLHGSTLSRIKLGSSNIRVDFYNVHLLAEGADDCDPNCRREELEELRAEIVLHSKTSGNPVIVAGDFNIGGPPACTGNDRYSDIMQVLGNPRDLWFENRPSDNGYTSDCVDNALLQSLESCSYRERIDFMLVVTNSALTNSNYHVTLRNPSDIRLSKFERSPGRPVSDHFGIEAMLEVRDKALPNRPRVGLAGKCMDVTGGQSADGTPIQLYDCNGTASQRWTLEADGELRGLANKCLTVQDSCSANRTRLELRTCNGSAAQRFDYTAAGELRSYLSPNQCVEARGGFTTNGTPIQLYTCNGTASQHWLD